MSTGLQPRRPDLRGKCQPAAEALANADPTLRVVRGWYVDIDWGEQEHWWCQRPDGTIVDPTVEQFPTGHVPALRQYREYFGVYPCFGCGIDIAEGAGVGEGRYCCGECYGADVGFPAGRCLCETYSGGPR